MTPDAPDEMQTLAAIDIGTNSFHLVVARVGEGNQFEIVAREKEMVRLGSGPGDMKELTADAMERGIECLRRFRKIAEISDAEVYAVATSAVREAENAAQFIDRARDEAGIEVEVVSGVEEARLIHLGVLQAVPVYDTRLVLVDIGGGSTEILVGERGETLAVGSVKLGALRLTRRFFRSSRLHPGSVDSCRRSIRAGLVTMAREVARHGFEVAVGSSGTIEAVAAMVQVARDDGSTPRTLNNFAFTRAEVRAVVKRLIDADTLDKRRRLPGMDESRADIILAGALILEETMQALGIKRMVLSENALREGALLDALSRRRDGAFHHLQDLRRRSVVHLMEMMDDDPAHSEHVASLALELFDEVAPWHELPDRSRELLEAAALLANVGLYVSHSGHHKHSYYVIRNSDQLTGFTDHEIELIALVARYHRKSAPKPKHAEFAALRPKDQDLVRALAAILRVAIALDRTHAGVVRDVEARLEGGEVVLELVGEDGADLSLEVFTAGERKGLLEEVLGRPVRIEEISGRWPAGRTARAS